MQGHRGEGEREQRTPRRLFSGGTAPQPRVTPRCEMSPCDPHRSLLVARSLARFVHGHPHFPRASSRPSVRVRSAAPYCGSLFSSVRTPERRRVMTAAAAAVEAGVATRLVLCMNKVRAGQGVRLGGEIVSVDRFGISHARGPQYSSMHSC